jgi:hypothetical protein
MADAKAIANALTAMLQPMVATITAAATAAVATAAPTVPPIAPVIFTRTPAQARADPLNKVTMVKPRSIIVLMLVGADALVTSWQIIEMTSYAIRVSRLRMSIALTLLLMLSVGQPLAL